jgi:gamma-glutamylcysteine synthetase
MKTRLTTLLLAFTFICSAQSVKYITDNLNDVRQLSDSIALNAKRTFKYSKQGIPNEGKYVYLVKYINTVDTTEVMYIKFHIKMVGANEDLEIAGTRQYVFEYVSGRYLDLFPFWKKFVNTSEDIEELTKKGVTYFRMGSNRLTFSRANENWQLSFFEY